MNEPAFTAKREGITNSRTIEIGSLLKFHDEDFVYHLYRSLLKRDPDNVGLTYYLDRIRAGVSRTEIILQAYNSPEVDRRSIIIKGIGKVKFGLFFTNIPIIGTLTCLLLFMIRIRTILKDARALNNHLYRISKTVKKQ